MNQEKLNRLFDEMGSEEIEELANVFIEQYLTPIIERAELEESYKDVYLNKYEVFQAIKKLARKSAPMVSAQTYYDCRVNAGDVLEEIGELKEHSTRDKKI